METNKMEAWAAENWSSSDSDETGSSFSEESASSPRMEAVRVNGESLLLPQGLCDNPDVFREFLSLDTWHSFSEQQRQHLKNFLPTFPERDSEEKDKTLRMLFARDNIRFGNPVTEFCNHLRAAHYRPDMSRMRSLLRKARFKDYKRLERWRIFELVKSVLSSRQRLVETVVNGEKPKVCPVPSKKAKTSHMPNVKSRYFQELALIREEVGEMSQSSEDESFPEGPASTSKKSRRVGNIPELLNDGIPPVLGTLCSGPTPWDQGKQPQNNPYAVTEQSYSQMVAKHSKRRAAREDHPDLYVKGITLQDIAMRCKFLKKVSNSKPSAPKKVKMKVARTTSISSPMVDGDADEGSDDDISNLFNVKCEPEEEIEIDKVDIESVNDLPPMPIIRPTVNTHVNQNASPKTPKSLAKRIKVETPESHKKVEPEARKNRTDSTESISRKKPEPVEMLKKVKNEPVEVPSKKVKVEAVEVPMTSIKIETTLTNAPPVFSVSTLKPPGMSSISTMSSISSRVLTPATLSDLDGIDMMDLPVDFDESSPLSLEDMKPHPELMQETHACFFSLIRDILTSTPDHRIEMKELELRVKAWASSPIGPINHWYTPQLENQIHSAVQFLAGDLPEILPEDYVPYMEWKAAVGAYQWIGAGRDSDHRLVTLCSVWLERGADRGMPSTILTPIVIKEGPEPITTHTPRGPAVQPTPPRDREIFRQQEKQRYETPYRAFSYCIGGVETAVGPVRSMQTGNLSKARGHTLLVESRPKYVTILELVRDAVSRLPNGQGTRADIVTLLKDSQYVLESSPEGMLSSVVSSALDKLHGEPDPSVKYDTKRKIWVNLHRGRSAEEFERLHALGVDVKTTKPKAPRKPPKPKKEAVKIEVPDTSTDNTVIIKDPNIIAITSTSMQENSTPLVVQAKPKNVPKAVTVPSVSKKVIADGVKSLLGKARAKPDSAVTQQQIIRIPPNQIGISAIKRPADMQKTSSILSTRSVIQDSNASIVRAQQPNVIKKVQTQSVISSDQVGKQGGKSIVKVITTSQAGGSAVRTVQRVSQVGQQQQVIQLKQPIIGDQKLIQKAQLKKPNIPGQQQLIVMKQSEQSNSGQQQMIVINQQQIVMDSQQLTLKQQKQLQQLLNKQQLEGNNTANLQQQQLQQLIMKQQQIVVEQQKNKPQQQMIVVKQQGPSVSTSDGVKQPMQQMILVKQAGSGDGETTTTQITQQQLQQMILLKQQQQQQQQQIIMVKQQDQKSVQVITQPQKNQPQQLTLAQLQQIQQQQRNSATTSILTHPRVVTHVGGQPVSTVGGTSLIKPQNQSTMTPVVAKVVTTVQSPVLTMESLLAQHNKQQIVTQAGVKLPTVTRAGISSQYVVSLPQSRIVQTSMAQVASTGASTNVVTVSSLADSSTVAKLASGHGVRIPGLNLAQITGKQVLLASKPQNSTVQGQNVILGNSGNQTLLVGGSQQVAVLQQGSQQILIPPGALKTLQGLKVIPITQGKPNQAQGRQQVFARIINPSGVRPVLAANIVQQESTNSIQNQSPSTSSKD